MKNEDQISQYLTFTVSEENFALNVLNVREVLEFQHTSQIPKMPDFMRGVINLRGSIIPVIDLKVKFGLGRTEKSINSSIVVCELEVNDEMIVMGLLTDSVQEVIILDDSTIEPTPYVGAKIDTSFIQGMGKRGEDFIIILNMHKILTSNELTDIQVGPMSSSSPEKVKEMSTNP
jgi:purine-binding chemotaxis protein CheW